MKYEQKIVLKNSKEALIRNADALDGLAVYEVLISHMQRPIICDPIPVKTVLVRNRKRGFRKKKLTA